MSYLKYKTVSCIRNLQIKEQFIFLNYLALNVSRVNFKGKNAHF